MSELSRDARWALKALIRCRGYMIPLGGGPWVPESHRPRITSMGLPAATRALTIHDVRQLQDEGLLEPVYEETDEYADPRRMTRLGWRTARELLPKKERDRTPEEPC